MKNGDFPKPLGESLAAYLQPKGEYYNAKKSFYQWVPGTKSQYSNVGWPWAPSSLWATTDTLISRPAH
ncbi:MAG: hypothetical protein O3A82_08290 [Verrucomicrobia bacterium]|nr:hypothetical protein [Verrucomicrobiota bacterium]MDA1046910.1 hypothetical protein [Verrucomicrobiota bacterium]